MRVDGDELLRLLVSERFPRWWEVENEQAAAVLWTERHERRRRDALPAKPVQVLDQLAAARLRKEIEHRRAVLNEALPYGVDESVAE